MLTKFLNLKIFDNHLHIFSFRTKKIGRNLEAVGAIFDFYDYVLLVKVNKKKVIQLHLLIGKKKSNNVTR